MKRFSKAISLTLAVSMLCCFSGCRVRLSDLTIASTGNVNLNHVDLDKMPQSKDVVGQDSKFVFLFIPFGIPNLQEAIDDALTKGNGDVLLDAVVYSKGWWFLVGQNTIEVEGNVVNTRGVQ